MTANIRVTSTSQGDVAAAENASSDEATLT